MGTLFIIATPIGNLDDITLRAIATLRRIDLLFCEDTRVTKRLLDRYDIKVPLESYREEVHERKIGRIVELLREGRQVGYVSDAGTPGISDPGARLAADVAAAVPDAVIVPIPGASAVAAALSVAGFPAERYLFLGFPPHKKGREAFFDDALSQPRTTVLYESTHRIVKALGSIAARDPLRPLCVARELTKIHETLYRGAAREILSQIELTSRKGEFVIVIAPQRQRL